MRARKLVLYGDLAKYFGKEHTVYIRNVEDAVKYLAVNYDKDFMKAFNAGYYYIRKIGKKVKKCLSENELKFSLGDCDLHIIPVVKGAANQKKKGWVKVAVGTLIAVVGAFTPFSGFAVPMGISIALSGLVDVLTYVPQKKQSDDNSNSTAFSPQNVGQEGTTIPVIYGKVKVGSVVVSSGTYAERNYSSLTESSIIKMLQRIVNAINNEIGYSLTYALTITNPSTEVIEKRGNYYYYPGRYPSIYDKLGTCLTRMVALESSMQSSIKSLKESFSYVVAEGALNQALQELGDCLGILRQAYSIVGETCDIDVEYVPTYVKKRGWVKAVQVLTTPMQAVLGSSLGKILDTSNLFVWASLSLGMLSGGAFALLYTWYSQRLNSLYRQSYSEDLYARSLSGQQSRRAASTFTPLDSCFFNMSVLQYYLENYTLFRL